MRERAAESHSESKSKMEKTIDNVWNVQRQNQIVTSRLKREKGDLKAGTLTRWREMEFGLICKENDKEIENDIIK